MTLGELLRAATKRERAEIAEVCHDSVSYLYQLAGGHRYASALMACRIEAATRKLALKHPSRFSQVPRETLVKYPEIYYSPEENRAADDELH